MNSRRVPLRFDGSSCVLRLAREGQDGWRVSFEGVDLGVLRGERVRWRDKESRRILTTRWSYGDHEFTRRKHALLNMAFDNPKFWDALQELTLRNL